MRSPLFRAVKMGTVLFLSFLIIASPIQHAFADETSVDTTTTSDTTSTTDTTNQTNDNQTQNTQSTPPPQKEDVLIRNGASIIFQGSVDLPTSGTISLNDSAGVPHSVQAGSVLGLLASIAQTTNTFSLSNLLYYSSFNSLYLKCVTPSGSAPACDNWQYVVNGTTPFVGMDSDMLIGGERVGIYFGSPHRVIFDTTDVSIGEPIQATAQTYNYENDGWNPLSGVSIGATLPNTNDPYNPTVVTTQPVDSDGKAILTLTNANTYSVGIADDYYFPSYTVTVHAPAVISGNTTTGAIGGAPVPPSPFSIDQALAFLTSKQNTNGSFGASLYTDWAAIAAGAVQNNEKAKAISTNILAYWKNASAPQESLTDNERHVMALLSLGQNPYSFAGTDSIAPILASFDGSQFGDTSLVNDDIFAIIPLLGAGYTAADPIITKDAAFILSKQRSDGSWEGSVDLTAAAVQALMPLSKIDGISAALQKASAYLENAQGTDGGFGSIYSTSWTVQAMSSLSASWTKNGGKGIPDYFAAIQTSDGAALEASQTDANRIWATSYAIAGTLGKPWNAIMQSVAKPIVSVPVTQSAQSAPIEPIEPIAVIAEALPLQKKLLSRTLPIEPTVQKTNDAAPSPTASPTEPIVLAGAAAASGTSFPLPIIFGSVVGIGSIAFLGKRFLFKKVK